MPPEKMLIAFLAEAKIAKHGKDGKLDFKEAQRQINVWCKKKREEQDTELERKRYTLGINISDFFKQAGGRNFHKKHIDIIGEWAGLSADRMKFWHANEQFGAYYLDRRVILKDKFDRQWQNFVAKGVVQGKKDVVKACISLVKHVVKYSNSMEKVVVTISSTSKTGIFRSDEDRLEWRQALREFLSQDNTEIHYIFRYDKDSERIKYFASLYLDIVNQHSDNLHIYAFQAERTSKPEAEAYPRHVGDCVTTSHCGSLDIFSVTPVDTERSQVELAMTNNELDAAYAFADMGILGKKTHDDSIDPRGRERNRSLLVKKRLDRVINYCKRKYGETQFITNYSSNQVYDQGSKHPNILLFKKVFKLEKSASGVILFQHGFPNKTRPESYLEDKSSNWWKHQREFLDIPEEKFLDYQRGYTKINDERLTYFIDTAERYAPERPSDFAFLDIVPLTAFETILKKVDFFNTYSVEKFTGHTFQYKPVTDEDKEVERELVRSRFKMWREHLSLSGYQVYIFDDREMRQTPGIANETIEHWQYNSFVVSQQPLENDFAMAELMQRSTIKDGKYTEHIKGKYAVSFNHSETAQGLRDFINEKIGLTNYREAEFHVWRDKGKIKEILESLSDELRYAGYTFNEERFSEIFQRGVKNPYAQRH